MHLGSIYLVVNDFRKSIAFYEKLLEMSLTSDNNGRFAQFVFVGHNISIMNGHFDAENPDKVVNKGKFDTWLTGFIARVFTGFRGIANSLYPQKMMESHSSFLFLKRCRASFGIKTTPIYGTKRYFLIGAKLCAIFTGLPKNTRLLMIRI